MNSASTHKNPDFWIFGLFFFLYFFIMATCFPFLDLPLYFQTSV
ncbi:MFS transporter, partial [Escherichia coli]|nr:MFS transporter [Escherichia coli]